MSYDIRANGVNPTESFGAVISARNISAPEKKVVMETVPYMDGFYDFSDLGNGPHYESRTLEYEFAVFDNEPTAMFSKLENLRDWLNEINGSDFYDEVYEGKHFTGAITTKISTDIVGPSGAYVKATIVCDPHLVNG